MITAVLLGGLVVVLANSGDDGPPPPSQQATSVAPPTSVEATTPVVTLDAAAAAQRRAVDAVLAYWIAFGSGDSGAVSRLLDVEPAQEIKELGLVEYSAAFGGEYVATCVAGAAIGDEIAVDCEVGALDQPLAEALNIGVTPTQFRVRGDKITRVGYLKPYSLIDLRLAAFVRSIDEDRFIEACSELDGIYLADAGVVYNEQCGSFMASFTDQYLTSLRSAAACGAECDRALLSATRPSKD